MGPAGRLRAAAAGGAIWASQPRALHPGLGGQLLLICLATDPQKLVTQATGDQKAKKPVRQHRLLLRHNSIVFASFSGFGCATTLALVEAPSLGRGILYPAAVQSLKR